VRASARPSRFALPFSLPHPRPPSRHVEHGDINLAKLIRVGKPQFNVASTSAGTKLFLSIFLLSHPRRSRSRPPSRSPFPSPPFSSRTLHSGKTHLPPHRGIIFLIRTRLVETARGYRRGYARGTTRRERGKGGAVKAQRQRRGR